MTRPIMFAANSNAGFEMAESMTAAPRYLYTTDALFHDDFITHGSLDRWAKLRLAPEGEQDAVNTEANLIWNRYQTLCETILNFLNRTLKGDNCALNAQLAMMTREAFGATGPISIMSPPAWTAPRLTTTPHPQRQPRARYGSCCAIKAQRLQPPRFAKAGSPNPGALTSRAAGNIPYTTDGSCFPCLYPLLVAGKTEEGQTLYRCYRDIGRMSGWPEGYPTYSFSESDDAQKQDVAGFLLLLDPRPTRTRFGNWKNWKQWEGVFNFRYHTSIGSQTQRSSSCSTVCGSERRFCRAEYLPFAPAPPAPTPVTSTPPR